MKLIKRDRRTDTEKQLDGVLEEISNIPKTENVVVTELRDRIVDISKEMERLSTTSEEYKTLSSKLTSLVSALASLEKNDNQYLLDKAECIKKVVEAKESIKKRSVDINNVLIVSAQLASLLVVCLFETRHVWTGKKLSFLPRWKV